MEALRSSRSDVALLRDSGRDPAAYAEFYRRHERLVLGWLIRRTSSVDDAADLTAETFAAAWLARDRYAEESPSAAPWLLGIARNKLRMSARKNRLENSAHERLGLERSSLAPEAADELRELFSDASSWLAELPLDQRAAVESYVLDDQRYEQIAAAHAIAEPAARKRVSRGLTQLRLRLKQQGTRS